MHIIAFVTLIGILCVNSQKLNAHSFDTSLWSNFLASKVTLSLQNVSLRSLRYGLHHLGTRLMSQFAECFCRCHDAVRLVQGDEVMKVLMPPCGAISTSITPGVYVSTPFVFSWYIPRIPSAIIKLIIEEFSLPMLSIQCQDSYVMIREMTGVADQKHLCGRLPKLVYFSSIHMVLEFVTRLLISPAKLCFSYSHGWQYEPSILDNNIITRADPQRPQSIHTHFHGNFSTVTLRKFLFSADFLSHVVIELHIWTRMATVEMYDGPGKFSPFLHHMPLQSTFSKTIQFYLYLETSTSAHSTNSSDVYIRYKSERYYFMDDSEENIDSNYHIPRCTHQRVEIVSQTPRALRVSLDVDLDAGTSTRNVMCGMEIKDGKGLRIHLDEFIFSGPSVQYFFLDAPLCQFGGLFYKVWMKHSNMEEVSVNKCENAPRGQQLLVGDGMLILYVLYFSGYSHGKTSLTIIHGLPSLRVRTGQCGSDLTKCVIQHKVWERATTHMAVGGDVSNDDCQAFQIFNPLQLYTLASSSAYSLIVLHMTAGSYSFPYFLGTVHLFIELTSTNRTLTTCAHRIQVDILKIDEERSNKVWQKIHLESILSVSKEKLVPHAMYISIIALLCPLYTNPNHIVFIVQLTKHKICDVVEFAPLSSQIAADCAHLTLPYHLGNASFYTEMVHVYTVSVNSECEYKMCLDISISATSSISATHCDLLWSHIDLTAKPLKIMFLGKVKFIWKKKLSCAASPDLSACHLGIDISRNEIPASNRQWYDTVKHSPYLTTLQKGSLKELRLTKR